MLKYLFSFYLYLYKDKSSFFNSMFNLRTHGITLIRMCKCNLLKNVLNLYQILCIQKIKLLQESLKGSYSKKMLVIASSHSDKIFSLLYAYLIIKKKLLFLQILKMHYKFTN